MLHMHLQLKSEAEVRFFEISTHKNIFLKVFLFTLSSHLGCSPVAEFSVSICSTPKFICSLGEGVPRLLITENDISYKSNIYKNKMM